MRVSMSPKGSLTAMLRSPLPARLHEARNQAFVAQLTQRNTAHLELAIVGARTARHLATIAHAIGGAVARQFGELQPRLEPLLHRIGFAVGDIEQTLAA